MDLLKKLTSSWKIDFSSELQILNWLDFILEVLSGIIKVPWWEQPRTQFEYKSDEEDAESSEIDSSGFAKIFSLLAFALTYHKSDSYVESIVERLESFLDITFKIPRKELYKRSKNLPKYLLKKLKLATRYKTQEKVVRLWIRFLADFDENCSRKIMEEIVFHKKTEIDDSLKKALFGIAADDFAQVTP